MLLSLFAVLKASFDTRFMFAAQFVVLPPALYYNRCDKQYEKENFMIRHAGKEDLPQILEIYASARTFMKEHGNPTQWKDGYPGQELLLSDMEKEQLYVHETDTGIHGVFVFFVGEDPNYKIIEQGAWKSTEAYGVIHRIASDGKERGIFHQSIEFAKKRCNHLRIDTHADNTVMQKLIVSHGFEPCGIVYVQDHSPRLAFEYLNE